MFVNAFVTEPLALLKRRSIRTQYTKVTIPKNRYGMRSLATFFLNESRNCLSWNNMPEMMKNNGIWNEKIHDTSPADCDVCPKTTSSMPKPRNESSAVSLELCAIVQSSHLLSLLQKNNPSLSKRYWLRTLDHGRPWRDDQLAPTRLSSSRDMSR